MNAEDTQNQNETVAAEAAEAPKAPVRRRASRRVSTSTVAPAEEVTVTVTEAAPQETVAPETDAAAEPAPKKRASRSRKKTTAAEDVKAEAPEKAPTAEADASAKDQTAEAPVTADSGDQATADEAPAETEREAAPKRAQGRSRKKAGSKTEAETAEKPKGKGRSNRNEKTEKSEEADKAEADEPADNSQNKQSDRSNNNSKGDSQRSSRTRQRDRKRRGADDLEPEITEDDVLLPIAGLLDVLDNYAFVRTSGYLPGVSDVYVSLGQVKKYSLRRGDAIVGAIRQPREGDGGGRQKYNALVKLDTINGRTIEENEKRIDIDDLTPVYPTERLVFGQNPELAFGATVDRAAPMGLGQRALITLPNDVPAAPLLAELAAGVSETKPDAHLMLVLTNAQPEAATELQRAIRGEVITAAFDRPAEDQITIVELAVERARRLVELGHDVVLLVDSLSDTALALAQGVQGGRGQNNPHAVAITQVKRLLAAARNVENGGSLTLVATARHKGHAPLDKELRRELAPVVNSFVKIEGGRSNPQVDPEASYTVGAL